MRRSIWALVCLPLTAPAFARPAQADLPLYIGVPESNVIAHWGHEPSAGLGYGTCSTESDVSAWHAEYDKHTDRAIFIAPRNGCFPKALPWRAWARQYLPPDAKLIQTVQGDGQVYQRYASGWLKKRVGYRSITVIGVDAGNAWQARAGWEAYTRAGDLLQGN